MSQDTILFVTACSTLIVVGIGVIIKIYKDK